jgi:hypothetical protein
MTPVARPTACRPDLRPISMAMMLAARRMDRLPARLRASNQILFE